MANDRRLIDADRLVTALELLAKHEDEFRQSVILGVVSTIKTSPKVDAVEVVRCKDCIHYRKYMGRSMCAKNAKLLDGHEVHLTATVDADFCSYGERRCE